MDINNYTCKIPIIHSTSACILNSEWLSSGINLLLLHDNQAWSGKFQLAENEDIIDLREQLSLSEEIYLEESRKALTTHNGANDFTYSLENDKFTWKKNIRKNMSVKFGNVKIMKVPLFEAVEKILDSTLHSNLNLSTKLQNIDSQRQALEKENNTLNSKLNELVEKKNEMEVTLYSQFLHILNEKKRRIKELQKKMPDGDNKDVVQSDESDHFDSDTEIDSEEEEKLHVTKSFSKGSSLEIEDEPVTLPKRSRQKRPNESTAGPSGESSKVKNLKVEHKTKQPGNGKKGRKKTSKESCTIGQVCEKNNQNLSESSEDVFLFKTQSKRTPCVKQTVKQTTSKINYESDDETDSKKTENVESDSDKTHSQISQAEQTIENIDFQPTENNRTNNENFQQDTEDRRNIKEDTSGNPKEVCENSEVARNSSLKGLSGPVLDILNTIF